MEATNSTNDFFIAVGKKIADTILSALKVTEKIIKYSADSTKLVSTTVNSYFTPVGEISKIIDNLRKADHIFLCSAFGSVYKSNTIVNLSTEETLVILVGHVTERKDSGNKCIGVFMVMSKAFDTVSLPILLQKLCKPAC